MTLRHNIFAAIAGMGLLASCSSDIFVLPAYTVGEADNAIVLHAGISEGGAGVATRALTDDHHGKHTPFSGGTAIALRVDGTWTDHSPAVVRQKTVATLGEPSGADNRHNALTAYTPQLYWDDYGTADPANATTGRTQGLDIYGAAIDSKTALPTTLASLDATQSTWTGLAWRVAKADEPTVVDAKQVIDQTAGWTDYDLLVSNNVKYVAPPAASNAYVFTERSDGKLLEFTHAMTKVTVNLTAGEGFPRTTAADPATAYFEAAPTVTLLGFNYTGTVNVEDKTSTPTPATTANIKMHLAKGGATHTATYDALVFPGNTITNVATDYILQFNADGNVLNVSGKKLYEKMTALSHGYVLKQGVHYILNITVNKTGIDVVATIADWDTVEAAEESPQIMVKQVYGHTGTAFAHDFDFFRSTTKASGYSKDAYVGYSADPVTYTFHDPLYWPDHQTHYFFRGVYPRVQTASESGWIPTANVTGSTAAASAIAVQNAPYAVGTYPSDLAIGWPRTDGDASDDETCKVHASTSGICATEGEIRMNFRYVMSQVEVRLKSTATGAGQIAMTKDNTKVEIIGGYSKARIKLSDGLHDSYSDADKSLYALSNLSTPESGFLVTSRDAIVPQEIGDEVKFRIIVTTDDGGTPTDPSDDKTDVYECKVKSIKETSTSSAITEWQHGKHYIYVLDINKTAINTTVTLTDWETVEASDDVWF